MRESGRSRCGTWHMCCAPGSGFTRVWSLRPRLLRAYFLFFFFNAPPPPEFSPLSLHDALPIFGDGRTEMRFEQRDDMTPGQHEAAKSGWGGFFDRMDERLA